MPFFAGLAGALFAHRYPTLHPTAFHFVKSFDPLIIVVFGGLGSITGTVVAAFAWAISLEGLRLLPQGMELWRFVIDAEVTGEDQEMLTTWYTERAVSFVERHKDEPFFLYVPQSMVHVPLFVKLPGQTDAVVVERRVGLEDVMPTVLDSLRLTGSPEVQGTPLRPLWESEAAASRTVFVEALEDVNEEKAIRSEERRVGKECRYRWSPYH